MGWRQTWETEPGSQEWGSCRGSQRPPETSSRDPRLLGRRCRDYTEAGGKGYTRVEVPCIWANPSPPLLSLIPCLCATCTQQPLNFVILRFQLSAAWLILLSAPGESQAQRASKCTSDSRALVLPATPSQQRGWKPVSQGGRMGEFQGAVTKGGLPTSPGIAFLCLAPCVAL